MKQMRAYGIMTSLVGSEMWIRVRFRVVEEAVLAEQHNRGSVSGGELGGWRQHGYPRYPVPTCLGLLKQRTLRRSTTGEVSLVESWAVGGIKVTLVTFYPPVKMS